MIQKLRFVFPMLVAIFLLLIFSADRHLASAMLKTAVADATTKGVDGTLRGAADTRHLFIGCAVATRDLSDPKLASLIVSQFNLITPEYEFMPEKLVDDQRHFTFGAGDEIVAFAEKNKMPVIGHMLVWHFVTRSWLFEDKSGKPLARAVGLANLKYYIDGVVNHYKGRIKAWDVVNEAISDDDKEYLKPTPALRSIGPDYVEKAFAFAHAADPNAELFYNDYNIEDPKKLLKTLTLIKSLKATGARLDAVGIQGHWLLNWPPTDMIAKGIDAVSATGVKVMITELDVDPLPRNTSGADMKSVDQGENPYPTTLPPEIQIKLAKRYGEIIATIVKHPSVTMINFWGPHDGRSWLNDYPVKGRTNHPLLFDRQYEKKPAFDAVLNSLEAK